MKKQLQFFATLLATLVVAIGTTHALEAAPMQSVEEFCPVNKPKGATIKVLVLENVEGALVEVKGAYNVYDPHTGKKLSSSFSSASSFMHSTSDGIRWGEEYPGVFQVAIVPDMPTTSFLVGGIEYRGMLVAYQMDGMLGFVNEVSIDDYAASIVSERCQEASLQRESIAALLIGARTDALYKAKHGKTKYWDVRATESGYSGAAVVRQDKQFVDVAQETSQMVMNSSKPVAWFNGSLPLEDIQKKAEAGKDARAILADATVSDSIIVAS